MGVDATSAESALFSLRRTRPVQLRRTRSAGLSGANMAARHVGSVATVYLSAGVDCPYGKLPNFQTHRRFLRVSSELYPVAFFYSDGTGARRGEIVGRQCNFESVGPAFAPPDSPARRGRTNICDGGGASAASASRFPPRTYPFRRAERGAREPIRRG